MNKADSLIEPEFSEQLIMKKQENILRNQEESVELLCNIDLHIRKRMRDNFRPRVE